MCIWCVEKSWRCPLLGETENDKCTVYPGTFGQHFSAPNPPGMASAQTSNAQREGCCLFWGFPRNTPILSNVWVNVIEILNCLKFLPPPSPTHKLKCFCQICEKLSLCYPNFSATWSHRSITRGKNRVKSLHRTNPQTIQQLSFHSVISLNIYLFRNTASGIDNRDCELLYQTNEVAILVYYHRQVI